LLFDHFIRSTSTFGGIVRPICFAALRLMLSPRRMRKVQGAGRIEQGYRVFAYSFLPHASAFHLTAGCDCFVLNLGRQHLPLLDKKQASLVQLSESSMTKLPKLRKSDGLQRSKTLDISSRNRKPRKGWE
jgi:hypothetical protein